MGLTESRWSTKNIILFMKKSLRLLSPPPICLMRQTKPVCVWGSGHLATINLREICVPGDFLMFFSSVFLRGEVWLPLFSMAGYVLVIPSSQKSKMSRFFFPNVPNLVVNADGTRISTVRAVVH